MLGTHSEPNRGEMSHICDISPLEVKLVTSIDNNNTVCIQQINVKLGKKNTIYLCTVQKRNC